MLRLSRALHRCVARLACLVTACIDTDLQHASQLPRTVLVCPGQSQVIRREAVSAVRRTDSLADFSQPRPRPDMQSIQPLEVTNASNGAV